MTGYSLRTSAAASLPSLTSCSGVYLFFGSLIWVCASSTVIDRLATAVNAAARADALWNAIASLFSGWAKDYSSAQNRASPARCVRGSFGHDGRRVVANTVVHHARASDTLVRRLRAAQLLYVPIRPHPRARDRRSPGGQDGPVRNYADAPGVRCRDIDHTKTPDPP